MSMYGRTWRVLAGKDGPAHRGLPAAELLAPLPLVALLLLGVNDWVLKGSGAPAWLTGKLSDFAGLFVFPLVVTSAIDTVLLVVARLGAPVDFTLRRWKLAVAIGGTAVVFAAIKLSPVAAHWVSRGLSSIAGTSQIVADRTDLIALVVLGGTWWHGRWTIARGSYGRLELARRRHLAAPFVDAVSCGADPANIGTLDEAVNQWVNGGKPDPVVAALDPLRT
jgi:hypothetical protein